ncbi:hypothetical protein [Micromonospora sp. DT233]|uniref:hypothetical protein n=1 Tax=Micromonospora sp. DT233 TaxID=3393432 RepID=UPI003CE83F41
MSIDSGWGDYLSTDTSVVDTTGIDTVADLDSATIDEVVSALPEPAASIVEGELTSAVDDQAWSSWHTEQGNDWAASAQDWVDYANENAAAGNLDIAESAMARAEDQASIADNNYAVADEHSAEVVNDLKSAAAEVAPYMTDSADLTGTDTSTYDAGSTYDASASSYDTSYSYDAGTSFDAGSTYDVTE